MKGLAYRKLGRDSAHRRALLRNLVTSLIQHERISTTYAKAKEAQVMAERIVSKAKRGLLGLGRQEVKARSFLFDTKTTFPLLQALALRYQDRPGGYTRLHLHGSRPGDNAPRALLEFIDQPRGDLKLEMTAMTMGRELALLAQRTSGGLAVQELASALDTTPVEHDERFQPLTRKNAAKVVLFGGDAARKLLAEKARDQLFRVMASHQIEGSHRIDEERTAGLQQNKPRGNSSSFTPPMTGKRRLAGMRKDELHQSGPDEPLPINRFGNNSVIRIGKGAFAYRRHRRHVRLPTAVEMMAEKHEKRETAKDKFVFK